MCIDSQISRAACIIRIYFIKNPYFLQVYAQFSYPVFAVSRQISVVAV